MAVKYNHYKFVTVSLRRRLCDGRFTSQTGATVSEAKWPPGPRSGFKNPLGLLKSPRYIIKVFFKAGAMGVVIAVGVVIETCMCKIAGGSKWDLGR